MPIPAENHVACITESELMQWVARGRIHLLMDRVFLPGEAKEAALFAACSALKLDDAKARVLVSLWPDWLNADNLHPACGSKKIFSLPISFVKEVAPTLPQYRRRLEAFQLKISDWTAEEEWDQWLVQQSAHERVSALLDITFNYGVNSDFFNDGSNTLDSMARLVMRPNSHKITSTKVLENWIKIVLNRDDILHRLRFEGHSDRTSFFYASLRYVALHCYGHVITPIVELPHADRGWISTDISPDIDDALNNLLEDAPHCGASNKNLFIASIYLRCFDELNYGAEDWTTVTDLIQLVRTELNDLDADLLASSLLLSYTPEKIRTLNFRALF